MWRGQTMACLEAHQGQCPWAPTCFRLAVCPLLATARSLTQSEAQARELHVYLATDSPDTGSSRLDMETAQDGSSSRKLTGLSLGCSS